MAVTAFMFGNAPLNSYKKLVSDLSAEPATVIKVALMTSLASPNQETWTSYADVVADGNEVAAGGNYVAGGATLTGKTLTYGSRVTKFDADDASWAASTITARYAVVYDATPAANADKKLLCCVNFETDLISTGGLFQIVWSADGIFTDTVPVEA